MDSTPKSTISSDNPEIENDNYEEGSEEGGIKIKCHCCGMETEKARLHYGGLTCYPCRSFFRRATVSKMKRLCKKNGRCEVKLIHRKNCNSCRYDECVRNGMRPHLVLSENQIRERFKKQTKTKQLNITGFLDDSRRSSNFGSSKDFESVIQGADQSSWPPIPLYKTEANLNVPFQVQQKQSIFSKHGQYRTSDEHSHNPHFLTTSLPEEDETSQPCHRQASISGQESVIMLSNRNISHVIEDGDHGVRHGRESETDETRNTDHRISNAIHTPSSTIDVVNANDKLLLETLSTIDIKQLENMYTVEEKSYIQIMGKNFLNKWLEINIGPEAMSNYIGWCKKEKPLVHQTFQVFHMTTRERFVRMAESTEEFTHLHGQDKFSLLKYNLNYAGTLALLRKLSFSNGSDFGTEDRLLWNKSGLNLHAENIGNILDEMPFDTRMKQRFVSLLKELQLPIMADQHVFSLMVAIFIFSSRDVFLIDREKIGCIREGYLTMLRRYVRQEQGDTENIINRVMVIISIVPKLSKLFQKMNIIETI